MCHQPHILVVEIKDNQCCLCLSSKSPNCRTHPPCLAFSQAEVHGGSGEAESKPMHSFWCNQEAQKLTFDGIEVPTPHSLRKVLHWAIEKLVNIRWPSMLLDCLPERGINTAHMFDPLLSQPSLLKQQVSMLLLLQEPLPHMHRAFSTLLMTFPLTKYSCSRYLASCGSLDVRLLSCLMFAVHDIFQFSHQGLCVE